MAQTFALLAIVGVPLLLLSLLTFRTLIATSEEAQKRFLVYSAASLAQAVDTELQRYLTIGQMLALSEHLERDDLIAFGSQARSLLQGQDLAVVVHEGDRQVLNSAFLEVTPLPQRSGEGARAQSRADALGQPTVSHVYQGALQKRWLATVEIPRTLVRGQRYALAVVFPLDPFQRLLSTSAIASDWIVGIADAEGRYVAGFPGARAPGNSISSAWKARLRVPGVDEFPSREGLQIVSANALVKSAEWTVAVSITRQGLDAAVRKPILLGLGAMVALVFSLLAVVAVALHRFANDLRRVRKGLLARLRGETTGPLQVPLELAELWDGAAEAAEARHRAEEDVRRGAQTLRAIAALTTDLIYAKDQNRKMVFVSQSLASFLQRPVHELIGRSEDEFLSHRSEIERIAANDRRVLAGETLTEEEPVTDAADNLHVFLSNKTPWIDDHGAIIGVLGISVDITERRRQEDRMAFVMREVSHRAKNILAVVQAVARSSKQTATSVEVFHDHFSARLQALAHSLDLLVTNDWEGVDLGALTRAQLAHFEGDLGKRIRIDGPAVWVSPASAQALGMAIHELATNASKYGALSNSTGQVNLEWAVDGDEFAMSWSEHDGPPVRPPARRGFGSTVIETILGSSFACEPKLQYDASGFCWSLRCKRAEIELAAPPC